MRFCATLCSLEERLKKVNFLIENLSTVITIAFSAYIVTGSQTTTMTTENLLLWAISLLGLIATSSFIEKLGKLRRIEHHVELIHDYLLNKEGKPSIDSIFLDRKALSPLEQRLQYDKEVTITGGSLARISNEYLGFLEQKAQEGCKLKFLLIAPQSSSSKLIAQYVVYEVNDAVAYDEQIKNSLANLERLRQHYSNLVEIRACQSASPFGLLMIDVTKAHGSIQVELYT